MGVLGRSTGRVRGLQRRRGEGLFCSARLRAHPEEKSLVGLQKGLPPGAQNSHWPAVCPPGGEILWASLGFLALFL